MSFKVGDKVKRKEGTGNIRDVREGGVYTVAKVMEHEHEYEQEIQLEGSGSFRYTLRNFELHVETPYDAILHLQHAVESAETALQEAKDKLKAAEIAKAKAIKVTYKVGDSFVEKDFGEVFTLYRTSVSEVALLGNKNFNRWRDPVKVKNTYVITEAEMEKIAWLSQGQLIPVVK